jgi:ABC-2 type transport system permease protein
LSDRAGTLFGPPSGVRGPSAIGGSWRQFWDLLVITSTAAFRDRYVDTVFGFVWMFLSPLLFFAVVYLFVTEIIRRFVGEVPDYGMILLLNVVLFLLFRIGTAQAMRSLVGSAGLVRNMAIPRLVLPLSAVATALYATLANLVVVLAWMLIDGIDPTWTWLLIPVLVLGMVVITSAVSLLLAGLYVRFRDVGQVWPTLSQVVFYASPVIWPLEVIPAKILYDAQAFNPIAPLLTEARVWIVDPSAEGWFEARGTGLDAFTPFIVLAVIWVLGWWVFTREARRAAEDF